VLPASFDFGSVFAPATSIDIFVPWPLIDKTKPMGNTMKVIGRLRPGGKVLGAQAELTMLGNQLESQHPERNSIVPRLVPLEQHVSGPVSPALFVLACAVGVVMLIVCANLSNLQLARLGARQKEIAMRAALGARRFRLLRQMLTESVRSRVAAPCLGLVLAVAGYTRTGASPCIQPSFARKRSDRWERATFHLACGARFRRTLCLLPALRVTALSLREGMQDASRGSSGGKRQCLGSAMDWWFPNSPWHVYLLVGAGLLIRSFPPRPST